MFRERRLPPIKHATPQETPRTLTSPRAPGTENGERKRRTLSYLHLTSGTQFDVPITSHQTVATIIQYTMISPHILY